MKESINELIKESMLQKDSVRTEVLRNIKTAFVNFETEKNAKPLDDMSEIQIINKLATQRKDSISEYEKAGRLDLVEKEQKELYILNEFLPKEATIEEVIVAFNSVLNSGIEPIKKNMGVYIKEIKSIVGLVDGKMVADYVKTNLL